MDELFDLNSNLNLTLSILFILSGSLFGVFLGINLLAIRSRKNEVIQQVNSAESKSFSVEALEEQLNKTYEEDIDSKLQLEIAISLRKLSFLYLKQIEQYQEETRARAFWSFSLAILAMFLGFAFIYWGGSVLLNSNESLALAAGATISTIGAAASGFITKTFLEVHKLSLSQLNLYFRQPVINDHIMMAQRLAEGVEDKKIRQEAYLKIIDATISLIRKDITIDEGVTNHKKKTS